MATLEEFILMWLLPEWTADVRGVYWILAQRRETCTEMACRPVLPLRCRGLPRLARGAADADPPAAAG